MPGSTSKRYPVELRERAVRMVAEVRGDHESEWAAMSRVAGLLGVGTPETVRKWVRQAEVDAGARPGLTTEDSAEVKRLKRENTALKRANAILKAASVNSTRQRNTLDDHRGGVAWRRLVGRGCPRTGGSKSGRCGRRDAR
jgi:transposase